MFSVHNLVNEIFSFQALITEPTGRYNCAKDDNIIYSSVCG